MKFKAWLGLTFVAALISGCSSLPEGSQKPELNISSVETAQNSGMNGFNVSFTLKHNSLKPLDVEKILTSISLNGTLVAVAEEEPDDIKIAPRREITLTRFIPANLAGSVAAKTLLDPLFYGQAQCNVKVMFTTKDEDPFNPEQHAVFVINSARKK